MEQIRPRINLTEDNLKRLNDKAEARNQNINQYLSDLLNGKVTERQFAKRDEEEKFIERHIFIPESLNEQLKACAAESGMTVKDYMIWLLSNKGKPIKINYSNNDIKGLIHQIEDIRKYLSIIAQGVEETSRVDNIIVTRMMKKTEHLLDKAIDETKIERKNRKQLVKEAKAIINEA